jgi:hypothetical protein
VEPEGSLPHLQAPATCPSPEPDQRSPYLPSIFLKTHCNIILPYRLRSSKWSLTLINPTPLPTETLYASLLFFIRAAFPAHILRRGTYEYLQLPTVAGPFHDFKFGMVPSTLTADIAWFAADQKKYRGNFSYCVLSFGRFPGAWILCADVSEHAVPSS